MCRDPGPASKRPHVREVYATGGEIQSNRGRTATVLLPAKVAVCQAIPVPQLCFLLVTEPLIDLLKIRTVWVQVPVGAPITGWSGRCVWPAGSGSAFIAASSRRLAG